MTMRTLLILGGMLLVATAWADDQTQQLQDVPEPPKIPAPVENGQPIEPDVTIIHKENATIEEYRVNGRMFMIKVTPKVGKPYYLVDRNGDGRFESRMGQVDPGFVVPQWVLFSW